ncbi:MAG: hypothetical protein IPN91_15910 [Holophagaceae bacterium]|uniref:Uncharacterized protein n=1 Tax=Candidatus Geothrix odensensis TaxID=2954440 RepID=A0A936F5A5_9BACT|nr:hypothetical protein [Candidatus Geothrix odensensis]
MAYIEGLPAPIYLSRKDVTKNVPNFQGLFVDRLSQRPDLAQLRYIDLRWDDEVAVGEPEVEPAPAKAAALNTVRSIPSFSRHESSISRAELV